MFVDSHDKTCQRVLTCREVGSLVEWQVLLSSLGGASAGKNPWGLTLYRYPWVPMGFLGYLKKTYRLIGTYGFLWVLVSFRSL